jgi:hypothetical protein
MPAPVDISSVRKPGPYPVGRRCSRTDEDGVRCITLLCTYTPGPDCSIHAKAEQASFAERRESFEELMRAA